MHNCKIGEKMNKQYYISIILFGIGLFEIILTWKYNVIFFVIGLWLVVIGTIGINNYFNKVKKEVLK